MSTRTLSKKLFFVACFGAFTLHGMELPKESPKETACYLVDAANKKDWIGPDLDQLRAQMVESLVHNKKLLGEKLLEAAKCGLIEDVKIVLTQGASIEAKDETGRTSLILAVEGGYLEIVQLLLAVSADIEAEDSRGYRALHCAADNESVEIFTLLLKAGANINAQSNCGDSPLHIAAERSSLEIVKVLLESGASVDDKDSSGWTPLRCSITQIHWPNKIIELLLEYGASKEPIDDLIKSLSEDENAKNPDSLIFRRLDKLSKLKNQVIFVRQG